VDRSVGDPGHPPRVAVNEANGPPGQAPHAGAKPWHG
jgi:hypothetical protein